MNNKNLLLVALVAGATSVQADATPRQVRDVTGNSASGATEAFTLKPCVEQAHKQLMNDVLDTYDKVTTAQADYQMATNPEAKTALATVVEDAKFNYAIATKKMNHFRNKNGLEKSYDPNHINHIS